MHGDTDIAPGRFFQAFSGHFPQTCHRPSSRLRRGHHPIPIPNTLVPQTLRRLGSAPSALRSQLQQFDKSNPVNDTTTTFVTTIFVVQQAVNIPIRRNSDDAKGTAVSRR